MNVEVKRIFVVLVLENQRRVAHAAGDAKDPDAIGDVSVEVVDGVVPVAVF